MRMNDHLFKNFLGLFVQWGKDKIFHHILKKHEFGIKVLQIGYVKQKNNVGRSWTSASFFLVFLRPCGKQGLGIQLQAN